MQIQEMICDHLWMFLLMTMIHTTQLQLRGGTQICMHEHVYVVHDTCCVEHSYALCHHKLMPAPVLSCFGICFFKATLMCFVCHSVSQIACRLNVRLHHRHAGNMLCVKLINQENLMREHGDDHPNPNIDVSFIAPHGRLVRLPDEVRLLY